MKFTIYLLRIISILSLLYFILIIYVSGVKTSFLGFWPFLSLACFLTSIILGGIQAKQNMPYPWISKLILGLIWFCLAIFIIVETLIIAESLKSPKENADYVIVLGAQVRGRVPSKTLDMRIRAAAQYLNENPNSMAICSGGQGEGEFITEALAIKEGLMALGIPSQRILLEEASTNTVQNLTYSKELIDKEEALVVIITSDFHIFRAKQLASHLGYENLSMGPANEFLVTTVSYYVREFFALCKDYFVGNIR